MSHPTLALVSRDLNAPIARVSASMPILRGGYSEDSRKAKTQADEGIDPALGTEVDVSVAQFLCHVMKLARQLPEAKHVLNVCDNRYAFLVAFCAAVVRSQTSLLPPNKNIATQQALLERYSDTYIVHDGIVERDECLPHLDTSVLDLRGEPAIEIPQIDSGFLAAISFTSGSTGQSSPNLKYWRTLVDSSAINCRYMLPSACLSEQETIWQLATVPAQHMWGLETSALLPLFSPVCVSEARPLFAQDIHSRLKSLPEPRMLVSTPVHLRALVASSLEFPRVQRVLCATAPLTAELAQETEAIFQGQLLEVYGCSEVGSMSCRATAKTDIWNIFGGLDFHAQRHEDEEGQISDSVVVHAPHLPSPIPLQDRLHKLSQDQFRLLGRSDDMIEIAGKRGSIQEVNKVLLGIEEVLDGVVFLPESANRSGQDEPSKYVPTVQRLAALVVLKNKVEKREERAIKNAIRAHFRQYLDAAFVPRPIHIVDSLPREENGKLPKVKLLNMFALL